MATNYIDTSALQRAIDTDSSDSPTSIRFTADSTSVRLFEAFSANSYGQRADASPRDGLVGLESAREKDSKDSSQSKELAKGPAAVFSAGAGEEPAAVTKYLEKYKKAPPDNRPDVVPPPKPVAPPAPDPRPEPGPRPGPRPRPRPRPRPPGPRPGPEPRPEPEPRPRPEPRPNPEPGPRPVPPNPEAEAVVDAVKGVSDADKRQAKSMTRFEELVLKYVNEERRKKGLSDVKFDPRLQLIALEQSKYQEKTGRCGHFQNTPGWRTPMDRMKQVGLPGDCGLNENAAFGWRNPGDQASEQELDKEARSLVAGWKSSPGHYKNMLAKNVTIAGISQVGRASTLALA